MTEDEAQRSRWTFYAVVKVNVTIWTKKSYVTIIKISPSTCLPQLVDLI
jgi:hypothetical protein